MTTALQTGRTRRRVLVSWGISETLQQRGLNYRGKICERVNDDAPVGYERRFLARAKRVTREREGEREKKKPSLLL